MSDIVWNIMKIGLIFGLAIKDAREKKGWTQEYLAELVGRTSNTIMNIENKGQYPGFGVFVKLVSMFDISVDQFIHSDSGNKESQRNGGFRVGASVLAAFIAGSAKWQAGQL